ncbi:hypothetical protein [Myxococcus sp. NMCA1]|uniref:hypothetical protein n=1 Tax=Myxococcus sp. NMCA1 TaxID=2996785 RepID=UPI002285652D|nr:hypothetical protein [Myxococcus sp. NMCA1]WAM24860.1 hypothetical protein OZ403_30670 [Myxococcus sp. NMCA1]
MKKAMTLFASVSLGFLVSACGGPEMEEVDADGSTLTTAEQAICEGYGPGAVCTYKCTSASEWKFVGGVAWGDCQDVANSRCGHTAYGACWSR